MNKKDINKMSRLYESILNEALPREFEFTGKAGERDEDMDPSDSPMMKSSSEKVKFPGVTGLQSSKFYLPYIRHFQQTYGEETGAAFGDMIARLAEQKLKDEHGGKFTGTEVEFRTKFLVPMLQDLISELGVSKGANELTSGYIARRLTDAFLDQGYLKSTKIERKPESPAPAAAPTAEDEEMDYSSEDEDEEKCDCGKCLDCRSNGGTGGYMK